MASSLDGAFSSSAVELSGCLAGDMSSMISGDMICFEPGDGDGDDGLFDIMHLYSLGRVPLFGQFVKGTSLCWRLRTRNRIADHAG